MDSQLCAGMATHTLAAQEGTALLQPAGEKPASLAAVSKTQNVIETGGDSIDAIDDDDLPELPEGYSYLGRRMVRRHTCHSIMYGYRA